MATYPTIDATRALARKYSLRRCVVYFTGADGRPGYTSYGQTLELCKSTRRVADGMWDTYAAMVLQEDTVTADDLPDAELT